MRNPKEEIKNVLNLFTCNRYDKRMRLLSIAGMIYICGLVLVSISPIIGGITGLTQVLIRICIIVNGIGTVLLILALVFNIPLFRAKKTVKNLMSRDLLDAAADEFRTGGLKSIPGTKNSFSNRFLYYYSGEVIPLKDILWIYKESSRTKLYGLTITQAESILAGLKNGKRIALLINSSKNFDASSLNEIIARITQENPAVLIGFTENNVKLYKQYVSQ